MKQILRRSPVLRRLRRAYWQARFRLLRRFAPSWKRSPGGLPVPNEELRFLVSGIRDYPVDQFLEMGRLCASRIEESLRRHGAAMRDFGAVLDFGCGCGRTLRQFAGLEATRFHGTDYNPVMIQWCRPNLAFAEFALNGLAPPLPCESGAFDLVYAFSVFTHLPVPLQHAWFAELRRVLRPGGFLALSTLPQDLLPDADTRARFARGELVVVNPHMAGMGECWAFHPDSYMRETLGAWFDALEFLPRGVGQDFWLLRKRADGVSA